MTHVRQRSHADCGIAAIAMFTGRTYAQAREDVLAVWPKAETLGMWNRHLRAALERNPYIVIHEIRGRKQVAAWAAAHLGILVVCHGEDRHFIVVDHGVVYDPASSGSWRPSLAQYLGVSGGTPGTFFVRA